MVRISDIVKRGDSFPEEKPKGEGQKPSPVSAFREKETQSPPKKTSFVEPGTNAVKDTAATQALGLKLADKASTDWLYQEAVALLSEVLTRAHNNEPIEGKKLKELVDKIVDQLVMKNRRLISLTNQSSPENYLLSHSANSCILSLVLGLGLRYPRAKLSDLGVAAFLHDIGMMKLENISSRPTKLTDEEYQQIKRHPAIGVEILRNAKDISEEVIYVVQEHHEGADGKGYPRGLAGEKINELSRIVSIVDSYVAMTHPRAQRSKFLPYDALKEMLKQKEHYDEEFLKVLIEEIGVYPIGSWVQLSTNEICRVIDINKTSPLRPIVDVTVDSQGKGVSEEKILDLLKYPNLHVKRPVEEKEALR